ncbi:DUF6247 family protein [Streptomyces sp. Ncost-T10-10d]|uniref:DUF6247 family protein n=1 Tax=Streptomyces sp. Ncost-T10-10d TaxID=1839774 RepID=UPI00081E8BAC|nr:DUF6247 family protein [Streptomyces sp. Ncost-T10-10d]SCF99054.1 hypothetical protein GA0115254_13164 [Streptomyces sp. Ncost-T10-10d]
MPSTVPTPPYTPVLGAPAELLAQLRGAPPRGAVVSAFGWEWATAPAKSRHTFSLTTLYEVIQIRQARLASAPAADVFLASGATRRRSDGCRRPR